MMPMIFTTIVLLGCLVAVVLMFRQRTVEVKKPLDRLTAAAEAVLVVRDELLRIDEADLAETLTKISDEIRLGTIELLAQAFSDGMTYGGGR